MGKIPEEAVKAAKDVLYYASPNDVERALAAAAPFLQGVKVKADPWVDTRLVSFDDTIAFGKGGFDFDRWESLRWEMHTRHGSFAVWKSDSKTWSMYGGKYGFLMLDRFSSEEEAKAEAEQLVISLDAEPSTRAQALEEAARAAEGTSPIFDHQSALGEYRDCESGFHNGRVAAAAAILALSSPDHADAGKVEGDGSAAARDVLAERRRQVSAEGWTPEHDDTHTGGEMAGAAACYALYGATYNAPSHYPPSKVYAAVAEARRNAEKDMDTTRDAIRMAIGEPKAPKNWPWNAEWWKPSDRRRNLVKAAALILAEIERLDRKASEGGSNV